MSAKFGYEVSSSGTEKEFVSTLISYVTGLSTKITCSSDPDTEYSSSDLTHVPVITFSINNEITFSLRRCYRNDRGEGVDAPLSTSSNGFNFICGSLTVTAFSITSNSIPYTEQAARKYFISSIINDTFIFLSFQGKTWYYAEFDTRNFNIAYTTTSSSSYYSAYTGVTYAKANIFDLSSRTFEEVDGNLTGSFLSRFTYGCMPGLIDYIKSSIYVNGGSRSFELTSIYDCTTVNIGDTISLKDGAYVAVGTHQLVKVS